MGWNDDDIAVLDGGYYLFAHEYPEHIVTSPQGLIDSEKQPAENLASQFTPRQDIICSLGQIDENLQTQKRVVIDARPTERFNGTAPEPRPSIPSGHMPNSVNIPFTDVLDGGCLSTPENIMSTFESKGIDLSSPATRDLIFSCGSGVSAAVVDLALYSSGCMYFF